jgi:hypothetical protein
VHLETTDIVLLLEGRKVPGTALQLKEALGRLPGNQVGEAFKSGCTPYNLRFKESSSVISIRQCTGGWLNLYSRYFVKQICSMGIEFHRVTKFLWFSCHYKFLWFRCHYNTSSCLYPASNRPHLQLSYCSLVHVGCNFYGIRSQCNSE